MAMYKVYDNILLKLENVYLRVEVEVDQEINSLRTQQDSLKQQLIDLKGKLEVLNSLKRSFDLYSSNESELINFKKSIFKIMTEKQISLRFLQEKELLLHGYLMLSSVSLPDIIDLNRDFKIRKKILEMELLLGFLSDDSRSTSLTSEIEKMNELYDLAIESGASDKLKSMILNFEHFFEKILNFYYLDQELIMDFKNFKSQVLAQANNSVLFNISAVESEVNFRNQYKKVCEQRLSIEHEVEKLLFQFTMLQNGQKIICLEIKNIAKELESILFKEYAAKQKIKELRDYKTEINHQKNDFMRDPTIDGYAQALHRLEAVEHRFKRLIAHKASGKSLKIQPKPSTGEKTSYHKILFQALHNPHISSEDKLIILQLSKPSQLITSYSGKYFYQRAGKTRSLKNIENTFHKLQAHELH